MADNSRSVPFTHSENLAILEEFNSYKGILLGKFNEECSNKKKHEVWRKITDSVNSVNPSAVRDISAVQKRFKNMVQEAKKELYKRKNPGTGGGALKKLKVTTEMVIEIYGGESPLFWGVKGGKESGVANSSPNNGETVEDAAPLPTAQSTVTTTEEEEPADEEEITGSEIVLCLNFKSSGVYCHFNDATAVDCTSKDRQQQQSCNKLTFTESKQ